MQNICKGAVHFGQSDKCLCNASDILIEYLIGLNSWLVGPLDHQQLYPGGPQVSNIDLDPFASLFALIHYPCGIPSLASVLLSCAFILYPPSQYVLGDS